jgi:hypothetical protein
MTHAESQDQMLPGTLKALQWAAVSHYPWLMRNCRPHMHACSMAHSRSDGVWCLLAFMPGESSQRVMIPGGLHAT